MTPTLNGQPLTRNTTATAGLWQIRVAKPASITAPRVSRTWYANGEADITTQPGDKVTIKSLSDGGYYEVTAMAPVVTPPDPKPPVDPKPEPKPYTPIRMMEGSTDVVDAAFVRRSREATISGPFAVRKWATLTRTCDGFGNIKAIADQAKTIIAGGGIPVVTIHIWRGTDAQGRPVYPVIDENKAAEQGRKACAQLVAAGMPKETILQITNETNNHWMRFWPSGDWRLGYRWSAKFAKAFRDAGYKTLGPSMAGFYHLAQQVCDYIEANGLQNAFDGICWNFYGEKGATPVQTRHAACVKVMLDFSAKHGVEAWGIECGPPYNEPESVYAEYTPEVIKVVSKLHGWGFWRQEMLPRWDTRVENGKTVLADSALYRRDKTKYPLFDVYQAAIRGSITDTTVTLTIDQRAVFDAINAMRAAAGLPACTWDASLAQIAINALIQPGDLVTHPPEAGGRGVGAFGGTLAQSLEYLRTASDPEATIGRGKVMNAAHVRVGVGIGDGGFYAVFGV